MTLYEGWQELYGTDESDEGQNEFWQTYFMKEQKVYKTILGEKIEVLTGTVLELAERFDMDPSTFTGFLDGINTSLDELITVEELKVDDQLQLTIVYEKLYYNMLKAKADWLYNLEEWNDILSVDQRKDIKKQFNIDHTVRNTNKISRNDACPCGSGKKYKKCCMLKDEA